MALLVESVIGVENRGPPPSVGRRIPRHRFTEELHEHLRYQTEVTLAQVTSVTMARFHPGDLELPARIEYSKRLRELESVPPSRQRPGASDSGV